MLTKGINGLFDYELSNRQLSNMDQLRPKKQVAVNGINSIAGNNGTSIYENGVSVIDSIEGANTVPWRQYTSCGKGEELVVGFFAADGNTYLDKNTKKGVPTGRIILAPNGIGTQDIVDNKSLLTYLWPINGIRYAVASYYTANLTGWNLALINLETMVIEKTSSYTSPTPHYDLTFDGINLIYFLDGGSNVLAKWDISLPDGSPAETVLDSDNNPIEAKRIYGLTDTRIAIQLPNDNKLRVWNRSFQAGSFNTREVSTNVIPIPKQVNQTYYWLSSDDIGNVYLKGETGTNDFDLTSFLVAAGVIGAGEQALYPLAITNYKEENGIITLNWILWRDVSIIKSFETLETIITPGSATTGQRYPNLTLSPTAEFMVNNTNNVTNFYTYDDVYNYGLQIQLNNS